VLVYLDAIIVHISSLRGRRWFQAAMLKCALCFLLLEKVVVSILSEVSSSGVSFSSRAYSSGRGRGKDFLRGPLYPFPHLSSRKSRSSS
jgi:hypothetical protein